MGNNRYTTKSPFYDTLKKRVAEHFKKQSIDYKSSWAIYGRLAFIYLLIFVAYYFTYLVPYNSILMTFVSFLLFHPSPMLILSAL